MNGQNIPLADLGPTADPTDSVSYGPGYGVIELTRMARIYEKRLAQRAAEIERLKNALLQIEELTAGGKGQSAVSMIAQLALNSDVPIDDLEYQASQDVIIRETLLEVLSHAVDGVVSVEAIRAMEAAIEDLPAEAATLTTTAPEPREESCHICGKLKGQPPERCPGHYSGTPSDPANFASTPASFTPAPEHPDTRQKQIVEWAVDNFGEVARNGTERALRFIEEAIELVQAQGLSRERVLLCLDRAYSRPAGELGNEIGGTMLTLEALAEVLGFNVEEETIREFNRISSIPKEKWQQKHAEKVAAGSAIDAMKEGAADA